MVSDPRPSAEPSEQENTELIPDAGKSAPGATDGGSWSLAPAAWPEPRASAPAAAPPAVDDDDQPTQAHPFVPPTPAPGIPAAAPGGAATPGTPAPGTTTPTGSVPTVPYRPPAGPPSRIYVPRPVVPQPPPSQPIMMPAPPRAPRRRPAPWLWALAVLVVVAVGTGLGLYALHDRGGQEAAPPRNRTSTEATALTPQLSGFSAQGSNFRAEGDAWTTQTYHTPEFGGLKSGVGLVLDLGRPERVTAVNFTAQTGPLGVDLRSADEKPSALAGWAKISGTSRSVTGATSLPVAGTEKHRYWLIWVTRLGTGNKAVIGDVRVVGITS